MLSSLKRLVPAALLFTATTALADSSLPAAEVSTREVVANTPSEAPRVDEQLRALTRTVESLETEVQQLRAKDADRTVHEAELLGQNNHPLWP